MKNIFRAVALSIGLLTAASFAYAGTGQGFKNGSSPKNAATQKGPDYVDQNGDGICDNIRARVDRRGYRLHKRYAAGEQTSGQRLHRGPGKGKGLLNRRGVAKPNYKDTDGDGICDNYQSK